MSELGLVQVYTGNGKGKTTAALGLSLRAVGNGCRVLVIQFLKGRNKTGELVAIEVYGDLFKIEQYGSGRFLGQRRPTDEERELAAMALQRAKVAMQDKACDLLVLDEVSHGINKGLVDLAAVQELIVNRPPGLEIVLTGRNMPPELVELADLVSEIQEIKHPHEKGVKARKGIEF